MPLESVILIAVILCVSYGIESIFGFAGTLISLAVLSFFFDIKEMSILTAFAASIASAYIFFSDQGSFNASVFKRIAWVLFPATILGTLLLKEFSSAILLTAFSLLIIAYSLWTLMGPVMTVPPKLKPMVNFIGGIFGGLYGVSGPMVIIAMREVFKNKSETRITLAALFLIMHLTRIPSYYLSGVLSVEKIMPFWWVPFPLFVTVWIGHRIHVNISEKVFQTGVSVLLLFTGVFLLVG